MAFQLSADGSVKRSFEKLCSLSMNNRELLNRLWAGTILIASLSSHCATILMSIQPGSSPKAQWNDQEVASLLDSLEAYKSEGEGAGNFKDSTFTKVLTAVTPFHTAGPPKTVKHCKTKWAAVCFSFFLSSLLSLIRFSSLNQYTSQFMPINTTSREPIGMTPTV
jgi:hypothetical protein